MAASVSFSCWLAAASVTRAAEGGQFTPANGNVLPVPLRSAGALGSNPEGDRPRPEFQCPRPEFPITRSGRARGEPRPFAIWQKVRKSLQFHARLDRNPVEYEAKPVLSLQLVRGAGEFHDD
jgi:hypothetical protein